METTASFELINLVVALPFVASGVLLCAKGIKLMNRFFYNDYRGNSREKFKDSLTGNITFSLGLTLLLTSVATVTGVFGLWILPLSGCFTAFFLPIAVVGGYWQKFLAEKLWGGFIPTVRTMYGYDEQDSPPQRNVDFSKVKVPRRVIVTAAAIALFVFGSIFYLLNQTHWNIPFLVGILIQVVMSALVAFGTFMIIVSSDLSRRVQKLRMGEPLDDE